MSTTYTPPPPFGPLEWILFGGIFCVGSTLLAIGATFTPGNPIIGLAILWSVVLGFWAFSLLYYFARKRALGQLRYVDSHGLLVGWSQEQYAVPSEKLEPVVDAMLIKLAPKYPTAPLALKGCLVAFREPKWIQYIPGVVSRKVAGVQDGAYLEVGWNEDLSKTALVHELVHRVFQVYAGDPDEALAHTMMQELGL